MKIILAGILCLFFGFNILAQETNEDENAPVSVEQIILMRDDGTGAAGDEVENFSTKDKTLHFQIQLSAAKSSTVKMILVAANVKGLKAETKSVTVSYKTNGRQTIVNFTASPQDVWLAGKYRADIFIDGKLADKKEFEIQSLARKVEKAEPPPAANLTDKPKPKTVKRPRKN